MNPGDILQIINIGKFVGMSLGGGLGLIGVGFIIQQVRFWVKGAPGSQLNGEVSEIKSDVKQLFGITTELREDVAEVKGLLKGMKI